MAATSAPYGLRPVQMLGGRPMSHGIREVRMTANTTAGIYTGDLVGFGSGSAASATATPTTTVGANSPIGICVGVRYTDPVMKQEQHSQFLPPNAITNGYTNVWIKVVDDPQTLFQVQASGPVTAADIGKNAPLGTFGGSTVTGNSSITLTHGSIAVTATLAVRIVDLVDSGQSKPGDAFTDCIVMLNPGVHLLTQSTGR